MPPWRSVILAASGLAVAAAALVACTVQSGPFAGPCAPFDWRFTLQAWRSEPLRLPNFGYLGHMWELYAMWAWVPVCLLASYEQYVGTALTVQTSLGFMLTLLTSQLIPPLVEVLGWEHVFAILELGPAFGVWSMWRLRRMSEALCLASGRRPRGH